MDNPHELKTMEDVREYLGGGADNLNWLILLSEVTGDHYQRAKIVECLIIQPRKARTFYGEVETGSKEDVIWLADQAAASLPCIAAREADGLQLAGHHVIYERTEDEEDIVDRDVKEAQSRGW